MCEKICSEHASVFGTEFSRRRAIALTYLSIMANTAIPSQNSISFLEAHI
jgi:hypothetical protein